MTFAPLPRFRQDEFPPVADRLRAVKYRQPNKRGWGPGWPTPQMEKISEYTVNRVTLRLRDEIAELVCYLVAASNAMGYDIRRRVEPDGGIGSFSNRPIKTRTGKRIPSWHSWGLAVDLNTKGNPQSSTFRAVVPPAVVNLWESCGFMWGGRWTGAFDPMHHQYMGSPEDVADDLLTAQTMVPTRYPTLYEVDPDDRPAMNRVLQHRLEQHGHLVTDDGTFGPEMTTAVKAFQREKGLRIDGIVGPITWGELLVEPVIEHGEPEEEE